MNSVRTLSPPKRGAQEYISWGLDTVLYYSYGITSTVVLVWSMIRLIESITIVQLIADRMVGGAIDTSSLHYSFDSYKYKVLYCTRTVHIAGRSSATGVRRRRRSERRPPTRPSARRSAGSVQALTHTRGSFLSL